MTVSTEVMVRLPVVKIAPTNKIWALLQTGLLKSVANGSIMLAISTGIMVFTFEIHP
jgi:hypothetical protein